MSFRKLSQGFPEMETDSSLNNQNFSSQIDNMLKETIQKKVTFRNSDLMRVLIMLYILHRF